MLVFDSVWKTFGPSPALRGISLAVSQGDALLVTGPSGAGKTTMLRLLYGAETADRGEVYVAGRSLKRLSRSSLPYVRRNLGVLFQDFRLLPERTACENVAIALEILGTSRAEARRVAAKQLADVGLSSHIDTRTASLSGGEQQRVALARALVNSPTVLLADEPTGSLDPERAAEVLLLLDAAHKRGSTVIVATHDPQVIAFGRAHDWRHAHLENGQLVDLDMPTARPARTDDDTDGFARQTRADDTQRSRLAKSADAVAARPADAVVEGRSAPADTPRPGGVVEGRSAPADTPRPEGVVEGRSTPADTPRPEGVVEGRSAPADTPRPEGVVEGRLSA